MGYSEEGLRLLLAHAFDKMNAQKVCNSFETERASAIKAHLAAGFEKKAETDGIVEVEIRYTRVLFICWGNIQ